MNRVVVENDVAVATTPVELWVPTVSVIVLSAGYSPYLVRVLSAVLRSRPKPDKVRLIWSGRASVPDGLPAEIDLERIEASSFDHGATRQLALDSCTTDLIAFLSDDAEPLSESWLAALTGPFVDKDVAAVFGRQVARPEGPIAERVFRALRYPTNSMVIGLHEMEGEQGLSVPISDANGAYRVRSIKALGGFPCPCAYGEDQIAALRLVRAGLKVVYAADAAVMHSHDLSWRDTFRRGFSAGGLPIRASMRVHQSRMRILIAGGRLVWRMAAEAWRQGGIAGLLAVLHACSLRGSGYFAGRLLTLSRAFRPRRDLGSHHPKNRW